MDNNERELLEAKIQKRLMTTFIFSVAQIEDIFGHLWNHEEEDETKLTEKEKYYDRLYEKFRKNVLDNGNAQIRKAMQDIRGTK